MILTLREENSAVATLKHQSGIRDFKLTCHLVGARGWGVFGQVSAVVLAEKMFFKNKVRPGLFVRIFSF